MSVSGTVYLDDQPLANASVSFMGPKHVGAGRTDGEGKYYLASGAEPGENKIYFSKIGDGVIDPEKGMDQGQLEAAASAQGLKQLPGQVIPAEYASADATKLTFNVPAAGAKNADFRLQSKK